jgi:NAD(P)-dependent dehydrogenase (short-subunit alcohol dehydrogenase family)
MDAQTIMSELSGQTIVVGAGRGLGRGIAREFADVGAPVIALAESRHGTRRTGRNQQEHPHGGRGWGRRNQYIERLF